MNTYIIYATKRRFRGDEIEIVFIAVGTLLAATADDAVAIARDRGYVQPVVTPVLQ